MDCWMHRWLDAAVILIKKKKNRNLPSRLLAHNRSTYVALFLHVFSWTIPAACRLSSHSSLSRNFSICALENMDILHLYFQRKPEEIFHPTVQLFSQGELFFWNVLTFTHLAISANERQLSEFWGLNKALNWTEFSQYVKFTAFANYSTH